MLGVCGWSTQWSLVNGQLQFGRPFLPLSCGGDPRGLRQRFAAKLPHSGLVWSCPLACREPVGRNQANTTRRPVGGVGTAQVSEGSQALMETHPQARPIGAYRG